MSIPPPLNTNLAHAIIAARMGYALPATMSDGPLGRLFERRMQNQIAERLPETALAHYHTLRDRVRQAVADARAGSTTQADGAFAAAEMHLAAPPDLNNETADQLQALGRSWIDQGYAYHALRTGDTDAARTRLLSAMVADERLEDRHGFTLMHIGRVHTVHLWLRLLAREGDLTGALATANAIIAYLGGTSETLPVGAGWDAQRAAAVPQDLRVAMTCRIASECGALLAPLAPADAARALERLTALAMAESLPTSGPPRDEATEIRDWWACKQAWARGDSATFLIRATPFLAQGRRETALWYAVLLDLCRTAQSLRPAATAIFLKDMSEQAGADGGPAEVLPVQLRKGLTDAHSAPAIYRHVPTPRRFHLICLGLPRSGTTSLYTLFANHRAGNEHAESATIAALVSRGDNCLSDAALDDVLLKRDRESALEMDATSFLHLAADRLPDLFLEARFVIPVRDPATWFDSYLRMLLRWHESFAIRGRAPPAWMADYGRLLFGGFAWDQITTEEARACHLPKVAERFLTHWAEATGRVLDLAPPSRRLILSTGDLSRRVGCLAAFAGLPETTLTDEHHANASPPGPSPTTSLRPDHLAEMRDDICGRVLDRLSAEIVPA